jgi:hypothetical protein
LAASFFEFSRLIAGIVRKPDAQRNWELRPIPVIHFVAMKQLTKTD